MFLLFWWCWWFLWEWQTVEGRSKRPAETKRKPLDKFVYMTGCYSATAKCQKKRRSRGLCFFTHSLIRISPETETTWNSTHHNITTCHVGWVQSGSYLNLHHFCFYLTCICICFELNNKLNYPFGLHLDAGAMARTFPWHRSPRTSSFGKPTLSSVLVVLGQGRQVVFNVCFLGCFLFALMMFDVSWLFVV